MTKPKNSFKVLQTDEEFAEKQEEKYLENKELAELLNDLAQNNMYEQFNFALLNLGTLLQTISVFFDFKQKEIDKILQLEKNPIKQRKMTVIINEINEKVQLKYNLDPSINVVKEIYIYDGLSYINIKKKIFIEYLFGKEIRDIGNMNNI